jgi:hypothetical protein
MYIILRKRNNVLKAKKNSRKAIIAAWRKMLGDNQGI